VDRRFPSAAVRQGSCGEPARSSPVQVPDAAR